MPNDDSADVAVTLEYFCRDQCSGGAHTQTSTNRSSINEGHRWLMPSSSDPVRLLVGESIMRIARASAVGVDDRNHGGILICSRCVTEIGRIARCKCILN